MLAINASSVLTGPVNLLGPTGRDGSTAAPRTGSPAATSEAPFCPAGGGPATSDLAEQARRIQALVECHQERARQFDAVIVPITPTAGG